MGNLGKKEGEYQNSTGQNAKLGVFFPFWENTRDPAGIPPFRPLIHLTWACTEIGHFDVGLPA
jgi:hypothetical protein